MTKSKLHTIQKQVVDITLPDLRSALDWEERERDGFVKMIKGQLERCFDEFTIGDDHLIIDKLEIDLGAFTLQNMKEEMPSRLYAEVSKVLRSHRNKIMVDNSSTASGQQGFYEKGETKEVVLSEQNARLEAFLFYLEKGYLPWWGSSLANWTTIWVDGLSAEAVTKIKRLLAFSTTAQLRIAAQFDEEFIILLIAKFGVSNNVREIFAWVELFITTLKQYIPDFKEWSSVYANRTVQQSLPVFIKPYLLRQYWLVYAVERQGMPTFKELFGEYFMLETFMRLRLIEKRIYNKLISKVPAIWEEEILIINHKVREVEKANRLQSSILEQGDVKQRAAGEDALLATPTSVDEITQGEKEYPPSGEMIYINQAGLVLLHPFLSQLFKNCGWVNEQNVFAGQGKTHAVYMLYYLATGKDVAPEHELLLPKLLMGIPWELPLEPVDPLDKTLKAAGDELLVAVIQHWKALRNVSAEGLREGFLERSGKLSFQEGSWRLAIESKTQDVLLGRLPWGISIIKLPWMKEMLSVSWQ